VEVGTAGITLATGMIGSFLGMAFLRFHHNARNAAADLAFDYWSCAWPCQLMAGRVLPERRATLLSSLFWLLLHMRRVLQSQLLSFHEG
jgi:hypothetical protein